jgi:hypothetical protein
MNKLTRGKPKGTDLLIGGDRPSAISSLRIALIVALTTICLGLVLHHAAGFPYWREVLVGTTFMVATIAFYGELVAVLLRVEGSAVALIVATTLKVSFVLLLLFPGGRFGWGAYDERALVWFLVGVLTLLPTGAIIAWAVALSERSRTVNSPE